MPSLKPYPKAKNQPCFVLRYTDPISGKDTKKYLHLPKKDAIRIFELKKAELIEIKYGLRSSRGMPLKEIIQRYLLFQKNNRNYNTYIRTHGAIKNFISIVPNNKIKSYHIEEFKRANSHRSPIGVNSDLRCIRAMLNWAKRMEYINSVPYFPMNPEPRIQPRILSNDEIKQILNCEIDQETSKLIELYLLTGARARELLKEQFTWKDCHKDFITLGSGNKQHKVQLSAKASNILQSWKHRDYPIPYTYTYIKNHINRASKKSGIKFTCHDLRRAAGAILLRNGSSIYEVSKFLGHSSIRVTEVWYVDLLKDDYINLSKLLESGLDRLRINPQ